MAMEMLDREFREDQSAILSNEISRCMIQNNMTLENLDEASCIYSIGDFIGQRNKYKQCFISFREVV